MGNIGVPELIFIFVLALLVFGPRRLPELGRTLGKALAEFRKHSTDLRMTFEQEMRELERQAQEAESKAREALNPATEPAAPPERLVGSGSLDPQQEPAATPSSAASELAADEPPREKPADGESKPA